MLLSEAMQKFSSFSACIKIPAAAIGSHLPMIELAERASFCKWVQDLGFDLGEWTYVHNYGEGRSYNLPETKKICPVVNGKRKNILNITWDLNVIPCCYDFNATIRFGNLKESTLEEIFSSPEYFAFLVAQQSNNLSAYPVCQNCEKNDYT
jgi:radical SAM protein with 4Fe4S-binding SPASM domain